MKRLIAVLLSMLLVCSHALAVFPIDATPTPNSSGNGEILFRNIPWKCSIDEVISHLEQDFTGYKRLRSGRTIRYYGFISDTLRSYSVDHAGFECSLSPGSCYVGGNQVETITVYAVYGIEDGEIIKESSSSKFIMAEYDFDVNHLNIQSVYDDLYEKLCDLYGNPYKEMDVIASERWWQGENNTIVNLTKGLGYLHLTYQKSDFYKDLEEVLTIQNKEKVSDPESKEGL